MELIQLKCGFQDCNIYVPWELDIESGESVAPDSWVLWVEDGFLEARCPRHKNNSCDEEGSH